MSLVFAPFTSGLGLLSAKGSYGSKAAARDLTANDHIANCAEAGPGHFPALNGCVSKAAQKEVRTCCHSIQHSSGTMSL